MKFLWVKLFFNILLTLAFLLWSINIMLPSDMQIVVGNYWWWFTTTFIIVVERWVVFFAFDDEFKKLTKRENN